ncbi:hypothetical protein KBC89_01800 [Candidatus Woesebacteria bacterium]|nr:hypothetical protein [Candidatus Woesebacteria bacterium]
MHWEQQGRISPTDLEIATFSDEIEITSKEFLKKVERIRRVIPESERMVSEDCDPKSLRAQAGFLLQQEDYLALQKSDIEPFSLSIFGTSEIIRDNSAAGLYMKLTIDKRLLMPEHTERFGHVTVAMMEFDLAMLNDLEFGKRRKILATLAEWEKQTGLLVRFEGVVGKSSL